MSLSLLESSFHRQVYGFLWTSLPKWFTMGIGFDVVAGVFMAFPFAEPPKTRAHTDTSQGGEDSSIAESGPLIGQYKLLGTLGKGGMGEVFRARHVRLKREVAIKFLHGLAALSGRRKQRFHLEMEALGRLDHPHIVRATDAGEWQGCPFLVMELLSGADLYEYVIKVGPLSVEHACEAIRQAALGLQYAHEMKLVHRDIKPSNLFLTQTGVVKILDMGLVRLQDQEEQDNLTGSQEVMGTADYIAPEQAENCRDVDIRADLYSLGCSLYFLLTGQPPFPKPRFSSWKEKVQAHASEPPPSLGAVSTHMPRELEAIFQKLLAKKPEDRYASPREVVEALAPLIGGTDLSLIGPATQSLVPRESPATVSMTPLTKPRTEPVPARRRRLIFVGAGLLVLAASFLAIYLINRERPTDQPRGDLVEPAPGVVPLGPRFEEPGKWYNLLDRKPKVVLEPKFNFRWNLDSSKEELWLDAGENCLLQLGESNAPNYDLEIICQSNVLGPIAGLFVGLQKDAADSNVTRMIRLFASRYQPAKGTGKSQFDGGVFSLKAPHNTGSNAQVVGVDLEQNGLYRVRVAVKVRGGALTEIVMNEKTYPAWPSTLNSKFKAPILGGFGVVGGRGAITITSAKYQWHRPEDE